MLSISILFIFEQQKLFHRAPASYRKVKSLFMIVSPLLKGPTISDLYETPQIVVTFTSQISSFCQAPGRLGISNHSFNQLAANQPANIRTDPTAADTGIGTFDPALKADALTTKCYRNRYPIRWRINPYHAG